MPTARHQLETISTILDHLSAKTLPAEHAEHLAARDAVARRARLHDAAEMRAPLLRCAFIAASLRQVVATLNALPGDRTPADDQIVERARDALTGLAEEMSGDEVATGADVIGALDGLGAIASALDATDALPAGIDSLMDVLRAVDELHRAAPATSSTCPRSALGQLVMRALRPGSDTDPDALVDELRKTFPYGFALVGRGVKGGGLEHVVRAGVHRQRCASAPSSAVTASLT